MPKQLAQKLDLQSYETLKCAIEQGHWPNGQKLNSEQTELGMQAMLLWEAKHLEPHQRTGYIKDPCPSKTTHKKQH